jgi:hypothetical protein
MKQTALEAYIGKLNNSNENCLFEVKQIFGGDTFLTKDQRIELDQKINSAVKNNIEKIIKGTGEQNYKLVQKLVHDICMKNESGACPWAPSTVNAVSTALIDRMNDRMEKEYLKRKKHK